jgi:hypothetical protein
MTKWYLLALTAALLCLGACTTSASSHATAKGGQVQMSENLQTKDKVSVAVTRGPESWAFFAFMFAVVYAFGINFGGALAQGPRLSWTKRTIPNVLIHLGWLVLCFYLIMVNAWVDNELIKLLIWVKRQPQ